MDNKVKIGYEMNFSGRNPANQTLVRLFYHGQMASIAGENRHPQIAMRNLEQDGKIKIIASVPQSIADGWDFWVELYVAP